MALVIARSRLETYEERSRRPRAPQAHLCAALPDKTLPRILEMEARDRIEAPVTPRHDPGCSLDAYMRLPAEM